MTDIQIKYWDYKEGARHNLVTEGELIRHNVRTEDLGYANLAETNRHNVQTETLGFANLEESRRHNIETENIGYMNASASMIQASAASSQAQSAAIRAQADATLSASKTKYQDIQNFVSAATVPAQIVSGHLGVFDGATKGLEKLFPLLGAL